MLQFVNKKILLGMIAKKAGIDKRYLNSMLERTEELFPGMNVEGLLMDPVKNTKLIDRYAHLISGSNASIAADYVVAALETIDPEGKAFNLIDYASELPLFDLAGEYTDVADFCENGLFPSLLKYRSLDSSSTICPNCFSSDAEKLMIRGELINFCNNCGEI